MRRFLPTRCKLIHKLRYSIKTATPATRRNSRFVSSISCLAEIFTGKAQKNSLDARLPGAITFLSKLRFMQNLYRWKVYFSSFPTVSRMTHFENQKTSKSCPKNQVRKLYRHANRGEFAESATWQIRSPRGICTRGAASPCAVHHNPAPHVRRITTLCELRL